MSLVRLPEEARVVETGAQHALVTVPDQPLNIAIGIQYSKEVGKQFSIASLQCKIFLMVTHHSDQDLFRQFQILRIEVAENHRRPLREVYDRLKQGFVVAPARSANRARGGIKRFADFALAFL